MRPPPTFFPSTHGCAAAGVVLLLLLPETMWCLRLLLLVVLLPWSSSVKREHTPAGTPLISEWFGEVSSAPADAVSSATPTSPLPPCRLIDETDELPATETPATPIQDVTRDKFRRRLHLSEGGTTAWTPCGTEALQHVEKNCRVKVEGETTKVKRSLFSWYHPNDGRPSRDTMFQRARRNALSEEKKQQVREKDNEQHRTAYHQLGDDGKEALAEKRAQGSSRDSTMASLSETERKRRSIANVIDYPVLVAEFWQRKTEIVREYLLRDLGIVACFDRMEYQSRGSVHVHSFWWHPNAPPDAFLDVLGDIVMAAEKRRAIADVGGNQNEEGGGESSGGHWTESADMARALRTVNHLASCVRTKFSCTNPAHLARNSTMLMGCRYSKAPPSTRRTSLGRLTMHLVMMKTRKK